MSCVGPFCAARGLGAARPVHSMRVADHGARVRGSVARGAPARRARALRAPRAPRARAAVRALPPARAHQPARSAALRVTRRRRGSPASWLSPACILHALQHE